MDLKIRQIKRPGEADYECVIIDVLVAANLGSFILASGKTAGERQISNKIQALLWFPDVDVNPGDVVAVYSKRGKLFYSPAQNPLGRTTHRFYLDRSKTLWDDSLRVAVILEIADFDFGRG